MRPQLPRSKRLAAARLAGAIGRLTTGGLKHLPRTEKLARIREISSDPQVLGDVLGSFLEPEFAANLEAAGLLRDLGADEEWARIVAEDLRERNWGKGLEG